MCVCIVFVMTALGSMFAICILLLFISVPLALHFSKHSDVGDIGLVLLFCSLS